MIGWMQKHKKYLIVTLWVSTVAFVGAGFVGWGNYQYGTKGRAIATVGDEEIQLSEFQIVYSNLYSYYSKIFKGNFDEAMADKIGLDRMAFFILKKEALMLNLARDYGLVTLDKEIAEKIYSDKSFYKDGNFSRLQYETILQNSRMTPAEYEKRISKDILIEKLKGILGVTLTPFENELFKNIFAISDKLEYKIIDENSINVSISEKEIKEFWETNKNRFMTEEKYQITYFETPIINRDVSDKELKKFYEENQFEFPTSFEESKTDIKQALLKKESKKNAMKNYLAFKKGKKVNFEIKHDEIGSINLIISFENMNKLKTLKNGEIMKPKFQNDKFVIVRLDEVVLPQFEKFSEIKESVKSDVLMEKKAKVLLEMAKQKQDNFIKDGVTNFIKINDVDKIDFISVNDREKVLKNIFTQPISNGFINLSDGKILLYRIVNQKFDTNSINGYSSKDIIDLKYKILDEMLIKKLEYYYPIKIFFKG